MIFVKILAVLIALVAVACVVALFTKKKYTISRQVVINKPAAVVFDFLRFNKNQQLYSVWLQFDPATKISLSGAADGTKGAVLSFASENHKTGTGEWEIKNIEDGKKIEFQLRFRKPISFVADGYFITDAVGKETTRLEWVYNGGMDWPMNFMLIFMDMDKIVGADVAKSLTNIKTILEKL